MFIFETFLFLIWTNDIRMKWLKQIDLNVGFKPVVSLYDSRYMKLWQPIWGPDLRVNHVHINV